MIIWIIKIFEKMSISAISTMRRCFIYFFFQYGIEYIYRSIKDRNGMDLTEAEDIKKRWKEHTEELYKKDLHDPDNHDGVITHLECEVLECEVKWA